MWAQAGWLHRVFSPLSDAAFIIIVIILILGISLCASLCLSSSSSLQAVNVPASAGKRDPEASVLLGALGEGSWSSLSLCLPQEGKKLTVEMEEK